MSIGNRNPELFPPPEDVDYIEAPEPELNGYHQDDEVCFYIETVPLLGFIICALSGALMTLLVLWLAGWLA